MADYGVTQDGFTIKGIDVIIGESLDRARQVFGNDVDLTPTSPLRKILEMAALEDANLWQHMEDLYYSNFLSTAIGRNLDLLGSDLGVLRRYVFAQGEVTIKLNNPLAGRQYTFPVGTILVTTDPAISFGTLASLTLSKNLPQGSVKVQALARGKQSNIASKQIVGIQQAYLKAYLNLGEAKVEITQSQTFTGGEVFEADDDYRTRLLGLPRNMWTLESVRSAVLGLDGVTDVRVSDPLGGVDASQSYFSGFNFGERHFSGERRIDKTYFFKVIVAHNPIWTWETLGEVKGIYDRVLTAVDRVRPIGVHPQIIKADLIEVGVRAKLIIEPGSDPQGLLAAIKQRIATDIGVFKLGDEVRFSQVVRAFTEQTGVIDVQNLHLRRYPGASSTTVPVTSQVDAIELAIGANLTMGPQESPIFRMDSKLIDIEVKS